MSILEKKQAEREADGPWDDQEAAKRGDCSDRAPHLRSDADGNTGDVRPGHELAEADDVGKFPVADPAAVFDRDAARQDNPAATTDAEERDDKERGEQSSEGNRPLEFVPLHPLSQFGAFLHSEAFGAVHACSCR